MIMITNLFFFFLRAFVLYFTKKKKKWCNDCSFPFIVFSFTQEQPKFIWLRSTRRSSVGVEEEAKKKNSCLTS